MLTIQLFHYNYSAVFVTGGGVSMTPWGREIPAEGGSGGYKTVARGRLLPSDWQATFFAHYQNIRRTLDAAHKTLGAFVSSLQCGVEPKNAIPQINVTSLCSNPAREICLYTSGEADNEGMDNGKT
jgi:hypothetical protein